MRDIKNMNDKLIAKRGDIGTVKNIGIPYGDDECAIVFDNDLIDHSIIFKEKYPFIEQLTDLEVEVMNVKER